MSLVLRGAVVGAVVHRARARGRGRCAAHAGGAAGRLRTRPARGMLRAPGGGWARRIGRYCEPSCICAVPPLPPHCQIADPFSRRPTAGPVPPPLGPCLALAPAKCACAEGKWRSRGLKHTRDMRMRAVNVAIAQRGGMRCTGTAHEQIYLYRTRQNRGETSVSCHLDLRRKFDQQGG